MTTHKWKKNTLPLLSFPKASLIPLKLKRPSFHDGCVLHPLMTKGCCFSNTVSIISVHNALSSSKKSSNCTETGVLNLPVFISLLRSCSFRETLVWSCGPDPVSCAMLNRRVRREDGWNENRLNFRWMQILVFFVAVLTSLSHTLEIRSFLAHRSHTPWDSLFFGTQLSHPSRFAFFWYTVLIPLEIRSFLAHSSHPPRDSLFFGT